MAKALQHFRVKFNKVQENGERYRIGSYTVDAFNMEGAKRKAHKIAQAHLEMAPVVADDKARWNDLTDDNAVKDYGSEHSVAGIYIHVTKINYNKRLAVIAAVAAPIIFALIMWLGIIQPSTQMGLVLRSVNSHYGRRVLRSIDKGIVNYTKLAAVTKDFNNSIGIDRPYLLKHDHINMIEHLSQGQYTLRHSYIVKTHKD